MDLSPAAKGAGRCPPRAAPVTARSRRDTEEQAILETKVSEKNSALARGVRVWAAARALS
jgi:hypothetical protein